MGMLGEEFVVAIGDFAQRITHPRILGGSHIAECDERIAPQMTHIPVCDVPTTVAIDQFLVGGGEQAEQIDPTAGADHFIAFG